MRLAIYIVPSGPARPVSADPLDVVERGVAPRWHWSGAHVVAGEPAPAPDGALRVRLPRRLSSSSIQPVDALRWLTGQSPIREPWATSTPELWESAYPRRGLGLPKPLPRRRRRASPEESAALFKHISDSLHALGVQSAEALNRAARDRLLRARGFIEQAVERSAPGARVTGYEVTEDGDVRVQILAPIKEIELRVVVSSDTVNVTKG